MRAAKISDCGSSPHMRGARRHRLPALPVRRIIPAHAGSTIGQGAPLLVAQDHPRTCGEHCNTTVMRAILRGSSPHMRGAPLDQGREGPRLRIIPAHAGSTRPRGRRPPPGGDHPRTCGEHGTGTFRLNDVVGSSPHMRGARSDVPGEGVRTGIIPAHAGSTRYSSGHRGTPRDHPRTCGEHPVANDGGTAPTGSSPHMRGARGRGNPDHHGLRIIPAHAGSTPQWASDLDHVGDHPRTCGEHAISVFIPAISVGSSPHMRGAPIGNPIGNSWDTDHPRTCGEHLYGGTTPHQGSGSSPHMRGALSTPITK